MMRSARIAGSLFLTFGLAWGGASAAVDPVTVQVTVKADGGEPSDAYVAFIAPDRPLSRPSAEQVFPRGMGLFRLVPGTYRAMVAANRCEDQSRNVVVAAGRALQFDLTLSATRSGHVTDSAGQPVAHVRVYQARLTSEPGSYSELALRYFQSQWTTTADAAGAWTLPVPHRRTIPVVIEAAKFSPSVEMLNGMTAEPVATTLSRGASLRAHVDRVDPGFMLVLVPDDPEHKERASELPPQVLLRAVKSSSLEWDSLRPGRYRVVGRESDPQKFSAPAELARVTLGENEAAVLQLKLPPPARRETEVTILFAPDKTSVQLRGLDAFVSNADGGAAEWVQHSFERAANGTLIYLRTKASPRQLFLLTPTEILSAADTPPAGADSVWRAVVSGRANITVHLIPASAEQPLPSATAARFSPCERTASILFGIAISRKGDVEIPFPTLCRGLTLTMPPYEPVVVEAGLQNGETRSFGPFALKVGATADIHAVMDPSEAPAINAPVRVLARGSGQDMVVVADGVTNDGGKLRLSGLPADRDVTIEAHAAMSRLSGAVTTRLERGKVTAVDPLKIPLPARLEIAARLAPDFRQRFPDAKIRSIGIEPSAKDEPDPRRTVDLAGDEKAVFEELRPGKWTLHALVEAASSLQPVPMQEVTLRAGEDRRMTADVEPAVFEGRVMRGDQGVAAMVGAGDPPSPTAVIRFAKSAADGRFTILLPAPAVYNVQVSPVGERGEPIELGEVAFNDPAVPVLVKIPEGVLDVRVKERDRAVPGVMVTARLRSMSATRGITEVTRTGRTGAAGTVRFESLSEGRWLVEARRAENETISRSAADVTFREPASVELNLAPVSAFGGIVHDAGGAAVSDAQVDCFFLGPGAIPQSARATTDPTGAFTFDLAAPPPNTLYCGVTTTDGAIAAWITPPTATADFVLPAETAALVISDWGTRISRDVYWLVSSDGRMYGLSWAAAKIGQLWAPLVIPRMPAGSWRIVRADSIAQWVTLATNGGNALPAVSEFRLQPAKATTLDIYPKVAEH